MVETLEFLIRQLAEHPRRSRSAFYKELLRSETYLLTIDKPLTQEQVTRVSHAEETLPVWADKEPEMGGVWVPVFPSRDAVADYVSRRRLQAPKGKEFLWMGHQPGTVFGLVRGVPCFAGLKVYMDQGSCIDLGWSEVKSLSEGRLPPESPELYDMPVGRLLLPKGVKVAFGTVSAGPEEPKSKMLCLPQAGRFQPQDIRKLVRLPLPGGPAWMACRHFLQALRFLRGGDRAGDGFVEDMLCSLITFQMYGEAEALCDWIVSRGGELYGWNALSAIFGRTGRLQECVSLCAKGERKYPAEKTFPLNGARALASLGKAVQARAWLRRASLRFPGEEPIRRALEDLG